LSLSSPSDSTNFPVIFPWFLLTSSSSSLLLSDSELSLSESLSESLTNASAFKHS
jgi:hypothetical protein